MTSIVINDLEQSLELDRKALQSIRGGWGIPGIGDIVGGAAKLVLGASGAVAGATTGAVYGGVRSIFSRKWSVRRGAVGGWYLGWGIAGGKPYQASLG